MEQVPRPTDALFTEIVGNCYIATGGQLNQIMSHLFVSSEYQPIPARFKKPENGLFIAQHRFYPAFTATAGTQFNTIPQAKVFCNNTNGRQNIRRRDIEANVGFLVRF